MTDEDIDIICQLDEISGDAGRWAGRICGRASEEIARLRKENELLREAIRRLAEQDATLSVQGGNVTVEMDATLTPEEREAVAWAVQLAKYSLGQAERYDALSGLLERMGGGK